MFIQRLWVFGEKIDLSEVNAATVSHMLSHRQGSIPTLEQRDYTTHRELHNQGVCVRVCAQDKSGWKQRGSVCDRSGRRR